MPRVDSTSPSTSSDSGAQAAVGLSEKASRTVRRQPAAETRFGLETRFDATFVAALALREKQIQQNYRPVIGIHKWFARRPGSVFRSLMLAEFVDASLSESYWRSNCVEGLIADPFMGGGTSVYEGLRLGPSIVASDINPMSYWLVRQAVEPLDIEAFRGHADAVMDSVAASLGDLYATSCPACGKTAPVKYFLWAKVCPCPKCGADVELYPGYLVAEAVRHPQEVYRCPHCRVLREFPKGTSSPTCPTCSTDLRSGNVSRGQAECLACSTGFSYTRQLAAPPEHRLFAMELRCPDCYPKQRGRQFKSPDDADIARYDRAAALLATSDGHAIPSESIPAGDETTRLHRWGYHRYRDMFNERQLLGLSLLSNAITQLEDQRCRDGLATVFSDFLRYQNLLARYDTYALKCQDIFSVHGFPVGLIACENNLLGIPRVGSGSFVHFVEKYAAAKAYAQRPYETRNAGSRKIAVHMLGETIEAPISKTQPASDTRAAWLTCAPSQDLDIAPESLDGVFTDPPYFGNVQYAELMDFCFVWLRKLLGDNVEGFARTSTRAELELIGNETRGRDLEHFTIGLSAVFMRMSRALKRGRPLVFTYHHNDPLAYAPLVVAILDSNLVCTTVLAAPAEMTASRHIAGTKSSILDSIFVCRQQVSAGRAAYPEYWSHSVDERVARDAADMAAASYKCTEGDLQCLRAGHVAAEAVHALEEGWNAATPIPDRLATASQYLADFGRSGA